MSKEKSATPRKFGMLDNISYAAGDFGCNMSFALKGTISIFWTQYMGLSPVLMAALLLVVQVWDAINDPLVGAWFDADHKKRKMNKFLSYILIGSIGLIISGALVFLPLPNVSSLAKCILFVAGYVLWDAFYTVANVPYGTMLSAITDNAGERASLSTWRGLGSVIANILTTVLIPVLCYNAANELLGERVFIAALIMGVIGFGCFIFMIKTTVIRVDDDFKASEEKPKFNVFKAVANFFKNRAAVGVTLAVVAMFLGMQSASAAVTVLFQSYFKNAQISGVVSAFAMIPFIAFAPFAKKLANKYGKKEITVVGGVVSAIGSILMLILPIKPDGTGLILYTVCSFLNSMGLGILSCLCYSMVADAIEYNHWKFDSYDDGTTYSIHSFFRKLAQGVGPSAVLVIMGVLGYNEANAGNQTAEVALNMRYLVPALYLFCAVIVVVAVLFIYNIDKAKLDEMNEALAEKAKAAEKKREFEKQYEYTE